MEQTTQNTPHHPNKHRTNYIRPWGNETERHTAYQGFLHYHNFRRAHGALGWKTPAATIGNNLPGKHS